MDNNPEQAKALAALESAYQDLKRNNYHIVYMTSYVASLYHATNVGIGNNDRTVSEKLASYWIPYFNKHMSRGKTHEIHAKDIELFFDLLIKTNILDVIIENSAYANTLAGLCLLSAQNQEFIVVNKLLTYWAAPESNLILTSLSEVVDHIYGGACWLLYRDEVTTDAQMPLYIWRMHLPLVGLKPNQASSDATVSLPSELVMA